MSRCVCVYCVLCVHMCVCVYACVCVCVCVCVCSSLRVCSHMIDERYVQISPAHFFFFCGVTDERYTHK